MQIERDPTLSFYTVGLGLTDPFFSFCFFLYSSADRLRQRAQSILTPRDSRNLYIFAYRSRLSCRFLPNTQIHISTLRKKRLKAPAIYLDTLFSQIYLFLTGETLTGFLVNDLYPSSRTTTPRNSPGPRQLGPGRKPFSVRTSVAFS